MIRIVGILFITLYMAYMYFIGGAFTNKNGSYAYQFLVGYIIFSACVAFGGILIQFINLSWWVFVIYLFAVYAGLAFVALGMMGKNRIPLFQVSKVKEFFSQQWFLYAVSILLTILAISNLIWIWGNNASDDGYYLSLVGSLPYSSNNFYINPSTGFSVNLKGIISYIVNTIYSEYSVYSFFTGIKASLLCRVYMSFFNYFLYGATVVSLAEKVFSQLKLNVSKNMVQYVGVILLFFGFTMWVMESRHLIQVHDVWQYNTAMYYGSSIVRMMSILWIVVPFFDRDKITLKEVIMVGGIGLALISKSTIALPLIIVVSFGYVLTYLIFSGNPRYWLTAFLIFIGYLTISILVGNNESLATAVADNWAKVKESVLLVPSMIIIAISCITRNKYIIRYNATLLVILILMVFSPINNIFETASVMRFVAGRAIANWYYTLLVTAFVYLVLALYFFVRNNFIRKVVLLSIASIIAVCLPLSDGESYSAFFDRLKILSENPDCIPASSVALGEVLEQRYQETGQMNVVTMVEGVEPNGYKHYPNTILRSVSPHSISLSAAPRFGADNYDIYQAFKKESQNNFNYFIGNPVDDTYNVIANTFDESHCNVIVMNSEVGLNGYSYAPFLARSGFELYKVVEDPQANVQYFVYTRNI